METKHKALVAVAALVILYILLFHVLGIVGVKVYYVSSFLKQCGFWTFGL